MHASNKANDTWCNGARVHRSVRMLSDVSGLLLCFFSFLGGTSQTASGVSTK